MHKTYTINVGGGSASAATGKQQEAAGLVLEVGGARATAGEYSPSAQLSYSQSISGRLYERRGGPIVVYSYQLVRLV